MTPLAGHYDALRAMLRGEGPSLYGRLVARQHAQPLEAMFARLRAELGPARFAQLVAEFRRREPPRDPNPARWASAFAQFVGARGELAEPQKDRATYDALCIAALVADDDPHNPRALAVAAFRSDPRPAAAQGSAPPRTGALVLMFYRDAEGTVRTRPADRAVAAAITWLRREAALHELVRAGVGEEELARGYRFLEAQQLAPARDDGVPASRP